MEIPASIILDASIPALISSSISLFIRDCEFLIPASSSKRLLPESGISNHALQRVPTKFIKRRRYLSYNSRIGNIIQVTFSNNLSRVHTTWYYKSRNISNWHYRCHRKNKFDMGLFIRKKVCIILWYTTQSMQKY